MIIVVKSSSHVNFLRFGPLIQPIDDFGHDESAKTIESIYLKMSIVRNSSSYKIYVR